MGPAVGSTKHASSVKSAAAAAASPLTIASSNFFTNARYCSRSRLFIVSSEGLKGKTHGVIGTGFVPRVSAARIFSTEEYVLGIHLLCRFNERLLEDLAAAIRTLCRLT